MSKNPDAIIIGSGPNGLAAAIELARHELSVRVLEAHETAGGGTRSAALTLPGFTHDICAAVHPFAAASPFFSGLALERHGLRWIHPPIALAHPLDGGRAAALYGSVTRTAEGLEGDADAYRDLMSSLIENWGRIRDLFLSPPRPPRHPLTALRFASKALRSVEGVATGSFRYPPAQAILAGVAAHGMMPLDKPLTAGIGLVMTAMGHVSGWPISRGGTNKLAEALVSTLHAMGGEIVTGERVTSLDELPKAKAVLCDLSPKPLLEIAGTRFPESFRQQLEDYRYGPGVYKISWALDGPIPWDAEECKLAGTLHLGGTLEEIDRAEREVANGEVPERPFVVFGQPSLFDSTRAPEGKHTAWGYCHVPNGSATDMTAKIESQVERFAPGFRDRILARHTMSPIDLEQHNPNLAGGDIGAGLMNWRQFALRPTRHLYDTPTKGVYICSAATPPGVGVHGMCGYFAARYALKQLES